jgi:hypothetical protein
LNVSFQLLFEFVVPGFSFLGTLRFVLGGQGGVMLGKKLVEVGFCCRVPLLTQITDANHYPILVACID